MKKAENLQGKVFGKITVLSFEKKTSTGSLWLCRCECGKEKRFRTGDLKKIKSCGCSKRKASWNALNKDEAALRQVFHTYQVNAFKRGFPFELSQEQFIKRIKQDCFYCGSSPSNAKTRNGITVKYNGIDRLNNNKGYTPLNSVPCCTICNRAKRDLDFNSFVKWANSLAIRRAEMLLAFGDKK